MFDRIEAKIAKRQFLSTAEYTALADMLAKIRRALTTMRCARLQQIESYYFDLLISAHCASKNPKISLETRLIAMNQFCYDNFGFGYWKFVD